MSEEKRRYFTLLIPIICIFLILLSFISNSNHTQNNEKKVAESLKNINAEHAGEDSISLVYGLAEVEPPQNETPVIISGGYYLNTLNDQVLNILSELKLPFHILEQIRLDLKENSGFINEFSAVLKDDSDYWNLVDKENPIDADYVPVDLVDLKTGMPDLETNQMLRKAAYEALLDIKNAASREGYTLTVLSAYRSFEHQGRTYTYWVTQEGQLQADRISAKPGYSQHQLGLAVDFNMLDNALAETPEGIWLAANASSFGWSLSYPDGYESITGYSWESWHYRFVGKRLAKFIDDYFDSIQQYALMFIHEFNELQQRYGN
ncbi:MAG: M15 family metallopeptidase [Treponema sp.]|nr:M15 family metallopeptidase [Treponema sp.]